MAVLGILGAAIVWLGTGRARGTDRFAGLPGDVNQALTGLTMHLTLIGPAGGAAMQKEIRRHSGRNGLVLGWAMASDRNAAALAEPLLGLMKESADRFPPGQAIDEALLDDSHRLTFGSEPGHGVCVATHLLLEVANRKRLPDATRQTLAAAIKAFDAYGRWTAAMLDYRMPGRRPQGGEAERYVGSTFGGAMAWLCEGLMLSEAESEHPMLPAAALAVATEYRQWREARLQAGDYGGSDSPAGQYAVMGFVRRLVAAMPATAQSGAARRRPTKAHQSGS